MSYDTGRSVDSSILETLMSKPLSISDVLLSSQNYVGFDGNLSITEPYLHGDEDYQEHFNLLCFLNQESSNLQKSATKLIPVPLQNSATNLFLAPSCFTESSSICSHPSTSCTNPYLSSVLLSEHHPYVDNSFLQPQPHILEQQETSTENLTPISAPSMDINFQLNWNAGFQMQRSMVIPQDILVNDLDARIAKPATVPCTSDEIDLQTEPTQSHQIAISNKDLKIKEIEGAIQETLKFSCTFAKLSDVHRVEVPKPRIRWNPELHECFVKAVDDLGGPDSATPRCILIIMGVDGLTIDHVKSHLQKYRHNKYPIDAKGEKKSLCMEEKKNEKEDKSPKMSSKQSGTLNMQWELQKSLHDQLKTIRELQLQTEESGRRLQEFMETQNKMQVAFVQATQSLSPTSTVNITERISDQAGRSEKHKGKDNTKDCFVVDPHIESTQTSHKRARLDTYNISSSI